MHELGSADGYAVIVQLRQRPGGAFHLLEGTVHPPLHRLERGGLVATKWAPLRPAAARSTDSPPISMRRYEPKRRRSRVFAAGTAAIVGPTPLEALG